MRSLAVLATVVLSLCLTAARAAGVEETVTDAAAKAVPAAASAPVAPAVSEPGVKGPSAAVQPSATQTAVSNATTADTQPPSTQTSNSAATTAGSQPTTDDPPPPPTPGQQRFLDAVQSLEAEGGAYDAGLAEQLLGLGASYQAAGQHAEATEALSRAAHIVRVNEGLYSTSDLPILERLIESYSALGEWDGVGSSYQQMFQIHRRNYGDSDERMLPALQRLSAWHLSAYLADVGENPINHLEAARNLYQSSVGILQGAPAGPDRRLEEALRESAIVDYYLASYVPSSGGVSFSAGPSSQEQAGPAYALTGFSSGRDALARVVELSKQNPSTSPLMRGQAVAELGDWHQLFNRRQTALDIYKEAWTQAAADSSNAAVNQIFGYPIALPVLPEGLATLADAGVAPGGEETLITVAFAVSERGVVEDIRIVEPPLPAGGSPPAKTETADPKAAAKASPDTQTPAQKAAAQQIEKLRKRLRATRFRPRFEAGLPMPTPDVTYSYRYSP